MKIPRKAKRVFKGEIFEVYQWRQKMFDGSYKTFERIKRPATVQVLSVYRGKILVTAERQPDIKRPLGLLGGRVDEGETPLACAKRELLEEAGFASSDWELFKVYEPHVKMDWRVYFFIARDCRKVRKPRPDEGERIRLRAVSFENFVKLMVSGKYRGGEFVSDILKMRIQGKLNKFKALLFRS